MTEQFPGPSAPQVPGPQVPNGQQTPQQQGAPAVYPVQPGPRPPEAPRSKAWIWWTLGIVFMVIMVVGSCAFVPILIFFGDTSGTGFSTNIGGDAVAVIRVDGVIAGSGSSIDGYISPEYFGDLLGQAEDDDMVKAIVLRVDSPGGTVAASEEIAQYVKDCEKPVVVSIGDVGASGAYMLASQSDEIWAMPGSAVGSIGVISEIPNVSGLLDKVGVEFQVITAGKYKDAGSPYRPLTKEETALIQGEVDDAYGQFIDIVADGRDMPRSKVESLATGWAWNGSKARELGLVDKIGTYKDALDSAADKGGIKGGYDVITYDDDQLGDVLSSLLGISRKLDTLGALSEGQGSAVRRSLPR